MMGRRSFLALLGLGPVAASAGGMPQGAPVLGPFDTVTSVGTLPATPITVVAERAYKAGLISRREYGEFMRGHMPTTRNLSPLDPDIEALRSFSAVAKRRLQDERQREEAIQMHEAGEGPWWERLPKIQKALGL